MSPVCVCCVCMCVCSCAGYGACEHWVWQGSWLCQPCTSCVLRALWRRSLTRELAEWLPELAELPPRSTVGMPDSLLTVLLGDQLPPGLHRRLDCPGSPLDQSPRHTSGEKRPPDVLSRIRDANLSSKRGVREKDPKNRPLKKKIRPPAKLRPLQILTVRDFYRGSVVGREGRGSRSTQGCRST